MAKQQQDLVWLMQVLVLLLLPFAMPRAAKSAINAPGSDGSDWRIECIDCGPTFASPRAGAAVNDRQGITHIFYGGEAFYHSWGTDGAWQHEIIVDQFHVGENAQAAVDSQNRLHVVYAASDGLHYGLQEPGQAWSLSPIGGFAGAAVYGFALRLLEADQPALIYWDSANDLLRLALWESGGWQHEDIVPTGNWQFATAVDSLGQLVVAFIDGNRDLVWGQRDGTWEWETVPVSHAVAGPLAIALDSQDQPAIGAGEWIYLKSGDQWLEEVVDATSGQDFPIITTMLGFDGLDDLWFVLTVEAESIAPYPTVFRKDLILFQRHNSNWSFVNESTGSAGSLLVTPAGAIELAYVEETSFTETMRLLKMTQQAGGWNSSVIVDGIDSGTGAIIDLNSRADIAVLSRNPHRFSLRLTDLVPTGWATAELDVGAGWVAGTDFAFAVGDDGANHQLYAQYCRACGDTIYRYGFGQTNQILPLSLYGGAFSLQTDSQARPHFSLAYADDFGHVAILYGVNATGVPGSFSYEEVAGGTVWSKTALALATDGTPRIVWDGYDYLTQSPTNLYYAVKVEGEWRKEAVAVAGYRPDLILDALDNPHILFFHDNSLMYTFWDGASWWQESVVDLTAAGTAAAIALGHDGVVHVAYHDPVAQALQYARRQNGVWTITTVDDRDDTGWYADIAVDEFGFPHIVYQNADRHDLLYATLAPPLHWLHLPVVR